jgi:hypothetical protein
MSSERKKRIFSGVSSGQADLVDSAAAVRKRQDALAAKLGRFKASPPTDSQISEALRRVVPELEELRRERDGLLCGVAHVHTGPRRMLRLHEDIHELSGRKLSVRMGPKSASLRMRCCPQNRAICARGIWNP